MDNFENCNHRLPETARALFFKLQAVFGTIGVFTRKDVGSQRDDLDELVRQGFVRTKRDGFICALTPIGVPAGRELAEARGKQRRKR